MLQHPSITDVCAAHTPHLLQQLDTGSLRPRVFWTSSCLSGLVPAVCNASGNDQELIPEGRENMLPLVCVQTAMHSADLCSACMLQGMLEWRSDGTCSSACLDHSRVQDQGQETGGDKGNKRSSNLQWRGTVKIWCPSLQNFCVTLLKSFLEMVLVNVQNCCLCTRLLFLPDPEIALRQVSI